MELNFFLFRSSPVFILTVNDTTKLRPGVLRALKYELEWNFHKAGDFVWNMAILCGMRDLSSPTRDRTQAPCIGSAVLTTGAPGK